MLKKPCRTLGFSKKAFSISLKVSLLITSHKKPSQDSLQAKLGPLALWAHLLHLLQHFEMTFAHAGLLTLHFDFFKVQKLSHSSW